jgi:histidinol-phosphate aminotransferase
MAGIRLGMAFASRDIITLLNHIKYPYNVNVLTQRTALDRIQGKEEKDGWVKMILEQREWLHKELKQLPMVRNILPSDANFLMVKFDNPGKIFEYLIRKKIIVRDRSKVPLCEGYLRITVGSPEENRWLISALQDIKLSEH